MAYHNMFLFLHVQIISLGGMVISIVATTVNSHINKLDICLAFVIHNLLPYVRSNFIPFIVESL